MGSVVRQGEGLARIIKDLKSVRKLTTKVGYIEGSIHISGTPVAAIAATQEFGSAKKRIPPRPFFRPTISKRSGSWRGLAKSGFKAMLNGNATAIQVMESLGIAAEGDIKKTISQLTSPPLAPGTIAARKAKLSKGKKVGNLTKPLVETGLMIKTLTSSVGRG